MTNLQEYLNQKYPTPEDKEAVREIILSKISEELEGGELDLREFDNLEKLEINPQILKTPLTKLNVSGLLHLQELILPEKLSEVKEESQEDKKLWEELGISEDSEKKKIVQEVKRLVELFANQNNKQINVNFATEKAPQDKLQGKDILSENDEGKINLYLNLERKDKLGNFNSSLVFWSLSKELTTLNHENYDKNPLFWQYFEEELNWVKENLTEDYQKEWELLLKPSTFPHEKLEIKELLSIYCLNLQSEEETTNRQILKTAVNKGIVDKTWQEIKQELIELTSQEAKNNPNEEELKKLAIKATVEYSTDEQEYIIQVQYEAQSPNEEKAKQLITTAPLQAEIELLKQQKSQLPTQEKYNQLEQEKKELEEQLGGETNLLEENKQLKEEKKALYEIVRQADELDRQKKLVLTELIQTPKQTEEAIKRLLKATEQSWREYFESEDPDIAEKKFMLGLSFKDPELRRKGKEILGWIIEARVNGNYQELMEKWQGGEEYNPELDFDGSLEKLKDHLQVLNFLNEKEKQKSQTK